MKSCVDICPRSIGRAVWIALLAWGIAGPSGAATPPEGRLAAVGVFDARVNAPESFRQASAARPGAAAAGLADLRGRAGSIAAAIGTLSGRLPGLDVQISGLTGAPESVANKQGSLTDAAPGQSSEAIVRGFLGQNGGLYGLSAEDLGDLVALGDSPGGSSGLRMLRLEQQIDGRPIFQSETRFLLDREGRLVKSVGRMVPGARAVAPRATASGLTAAEAVVKLLAAEGKVAPAEAFTITGSRAAGIELTGTELYVAGPITAREVLFPLAPGLLVRAWSLVVFTVGEADWYAMVDAETGALLWRKNIRNSVSAHDARFRVYVQADGTTPADSPAPQSPNTVVVGSGTQFAEIAPTIVSMHTAMDATASPNGWINDCPVGGCTANETQTLGNNVLACLDRTPAGAGNNVCDTDAASVLDGNGRPTGNPDVNARNRDFLGTTPRDFQTGFLPSPQGGNPETGQTATGDGNNGTLAVDQFRRGMLTHLFYVTNWYHDQLFKLGFDEASGNFQQTNFSGQGLGGDRINADGEDGGGTNNANFSTPPDGTSGRMQMYIFTGPTIDRDGALDAEISMHEMTHGTSNRLVGNGAGLNWAPGEGMGEGWSDFVALSLLNNTNADGPTGHYATGAYATYKLSAGYLDNYVYGIRRFPYTTDHSVNPMTWADVDDVTNNLSGGIAPSPINFNGNGGMEVHNSGEIWALTLWGVRSQIIADPLGANGSVPTGNHTMLQLTIDALKATPLDPSFIDGRNAFFDADCATHACANEGSLWAGFADRGLGYGAQAPYKKSGRYLSSHEGIQESFKVPYLDVVNPATDVTVDDSAANHNGALDPGEAVRLTVKLTNPWRAASKAVASATATLSTTTAGVTIYNATATYGAIAPAGSATGTSFLISLAPSVPCGSAIDFTLTTVSSLGTTAAPFRLRVGAASGTDPVVTYTGTPAPALTIVSNAPRGVFHQITVTDDLQIADLNFRINSITHPAVGDLTVLLRSPGGIGTDLVALIDGLNDLGGTAITNMVIDDDVAATGANDMVEATAAAAPYTKSWLPVDNSPWLALVNPAVPADPVGNLSRFDGQSTKGTWSALVADVFSSANGGADGNGTFSGWSLIVTPVHFACAAFTPSAAVKGTMTVAGSFQVGGTVTYTVVLTNSGTGNQADNLGNELTDVLPAGLTLVSATATSGTAITSGNTAFWSGSLAPLGGTTTLTITATINPGTAGAAISNQGTVSFDADVNGSNESTAPTDDPTVGGASDPTVFTVAGGTGAFVTGTKSVSGSFLSGGAVVYTIVLTNSGTSGQADNPGHELVDVLPTQLELTGASATAGTAVGTIATRMVTWNGSIAAGASVTITIQATINPGHEGATVSNQGTISYDSNGDGTNDATHLTDDPGPAGTSDPTQFVVLSGSFYTLTPCRLVDTRLPDGPLGGPALVPGQERPFVLAGQCDVPASAAAVALNVTVTQTAGSGFATVWPDGEARPSTSTINFSAGQTRANNAVVKLGPAGGLRAVAAAPTQLVIDVTGYFQ
jgi:uncharacterized repeat protein (TIGR01451 family)